MHLSQIRPSEIYFVVGLVLAQAAQPVGSGDVSALLQTTFPTTEANESLRQVHQRISLDVTLPYSSFPKAMPMIGFGTCRLGFGTHQTADVRTSVGLFLQEGGRLIDTADLYGNLQDVDAAIRESEVPREDLWVTSKIFRENTQADVEARVDGILKELGLDYVDLMLNHGPSSNGVVNEARWRGLLAAKKAGKARNVGVSNFNIEQLQRLEEAGLERPSVNQIRLHPWVEPELKDILRFCKKQGIVVTAYSSFGGFRNVGEKEKGGLAVETIATKYGVSSAQVLLRWALDQGVAVIPGASSRAHIQENLQIPDFHLDASDFRLIEEAPMGAGWPTQAAIKAV